MNTLYVSDLDGTLLQPDITISPYSISVINELTDHGTLFSIATARTIASVKHIIKDLRLPVPIVLMNGVCIYDNRKGDYLKIETLSSHSIEVLMDVILRYRLKGFVYTIKDGVMNTYYEELANQAMRDFYRQRVDLYQKRFLQIERFAALSSEPIVYFSLLDIRDRLEPVYRILESIPELNCTFYKDNYTADSWFLEIFSKTASKYHAVRYLRNYLKLDKVICFGDNRNDFPLFDASDFKIAVGNAIPELKAKAHLVIGTNEEDGVADWMKNNIATA